MEFSPYLAPWTVRCIYYSKISPPCKGVVADTWLRYGLQAWGTLLASKPSRGPCPEKIPARCGPKYESQPQRLKGTSPCNPPEYRQFCRFCGLGNKCRCFFFVLVRPFLPVSSNRGVICDLCYAVPRMLISALTTRLLLCSPTGPLLPRTLAGSSRRCCNAGSV